MSIDVGKLIESGRQYYGELKEEYSREYSWAHCYKAFTSYRGKETTNDELDYLALHLGMYLASWGMYRGSFFLFQRTDYKVHIEVVNILLEKQYDELWNLNDNLNWKILDEIRKRINDCYAEAIKQKGKKISDILITKILMGTLCCTPAYDEKTHSTLVLLGRCGTFSEKSMKKIIEFYKENKKDFDRLSDVAAEKEDIKPYPVMKVIDACLWQHAKQTT